MTAHCSPLCLPRPARSVLHTHSSPVPSRESRASLDNNGERASRVSVTLAKERQGLASAPMSCPHSSDFLCTVSRCGLEPDWPRRVFAMLLKPCSRSAVVRHSKRGIQARRLKVAMRLLHVRERARWTASAGARDAHIRLRLHVGALRQQRPNHLCVALLRGEVERRPSVLRRKRASRSAPPSAILPRPVSLPDALSL